MKNNKTYRPSPAMVPNFWSSQSCTEKYRV